MGSPVRQFRSGRFSGPSIGVNRHCNNLRLRQQHTVALNPLPEVKARALHAGERRAHQQGVVDAGRGAIVDRDPRNRENPVIRLAGRHAHDTQHFRPSALEKPQIAGVVDHAREIRVLVIDPHRQQVLAVYDSADIGRVAHPPRIEHARDRLHRRMGVIWDRPHPDRAKKPQLD